MGPDEGMVGSCISLEWSKMSGSSEELSEIQTSSSSSQCHEVSLDHAKARKDDEVKGVSRGRFTTAELSHMMNHDDPTLIPAAPCLLCENWLLF
jgi:hypothetical protein